MNRKLWLDWMKVIGMFAIILGHLFPNGLVPFIYSFSVPLFFLISGYLTNIHQDAWGYLSKLFRGLVMPYSLIWLANVVIYALMAKSIPSDIVEKFTGFLLGLESYIGALWFVYTLILLKAIAWVVGKSGKPTIVFLCINIICIGGMYWLNACDQSRLIEPVTVMWPSLSVMFQGRIAWAWTNVLCAMPFFCIGLIFRESNMLNLFVEKISGMKSIPLLLSAMVALVILYPLSEMNGNMFMYDCGYGNYISLCYLNALIGSFAVLLISVSMQQYFRGGVILLATGSIVILGFHGIPLNITTLKFPYLTNVGGEILGSFMYAFILYIAFIPVVKLVARYCPVFLGHRKK